MLSVGVWCLKRKAGEVVLDGSSGTMPVAKTVWWVSSDADSTVHCLLPGHRSCRTIRRWQDGVGDLVVPHFFSCLNLSHLESDGFGECENAEVCAKALANRYVAVKIILQVK